MKFFNVLFSLALPLLTAGRFIEEFEAAASGAQAIPEVVSSASANLKLNFQLTMKHFEWELRIYNAVGVTSVVLECGTAGIEGDGEDIVTLLPEQDPANYNGFVIQDISSNNDITAMDCEGTTISNVASLYEAVLLRKVYLLLRTAKNPGGEIRAQIW
jgi:hypothetical protein